MPSIQGIYYYFYAFYRWHNHISFKVTLRSGIKNKNFVFCFVIPERSVTLQAVSKMEGCVQTLKGGYKNMASKEFIRILCETSLVKKRITDWLR